MLTQPRGIQFHILQIQRERERTDVVVDCLRLVYGDRTPDDCSQNGNRSLLIFTERRGGQYSYTAEAVRIY